MSSISAIARAIARPIRMLVKLPGPRPTTSASSSRGSGTSASTASSRSPARAALPRAPGVTAQTAPKVVAVSKAKIVVTVDPHATMGLVDVIEGNGRACVREPLPAVLGPFDEGDRAVEVRLEVAPPLLVERGHPVEVEVRNGRRGLVAVADRVRGARDRLSHAERAGSAA